MQLSTVINKLNFNGSIYYFLSTSIFLFDIVRCWYNLGVLVMPNTVIADTSVRDNGITTQYQFPTQQLETIVSGWLQ